MLDSGLSYFFTKRRDLTTDKHCAQPGFTKVRLVVGSLCTFKNSNSYCVFVFFHFYVLCFFNCLGHYYSNNDSTKLTNNLLLLQLRPKSILGYFSCTVRTRHFYPNNIFFFIVNYGSDVIINLKQLIGIVTHSWTVNFSLSLDILRNEYLFFYDLNDIVFGDVIIDMLKLKIFYISDIILVKLTYVSTNCFFNCCNLTPTLTEYQVNISYIIVYTCRLCIELYFRFLLQEAKTVYSTSVRNVCLISCSKNTYNYLIGLFINYLNEKEHLNDR